MSAAEYKAIVLRCFEEAFNRRNGAVVDDFFAPYVVYHARTTDVHGLEGMHQLVTSLLTAFPDFQVTPEDVVAEGNMVVIRFTNRGTHQGAFLGIPPTGKQVSWMGVDLFRFAEGKIVDGGGVFDRLGFLQPLEEVPPLTSQ